MKKLCSFFLLFLSCLSLFPQNKTQKEYERIIQHYDILYSLNGEHGTANDFWKLLEDNHIGLGKFNRALAKGRRTALKAQADVKEALGVVENGYKALYTYDNDPDIKSYTSHIEDNCLGVDKTRVQIHIAYGESPNAFATPRGDIYLYSSLLKQLDYDEMMIAAVSAHEAAHYYLKHSVRQRWIDRKNERKNNIWAGVAIGLMVTAEVANAYASGYANPYGRNRYDSQLAENIVDIISIAKYSSALSHFKYSREEELEADIVAYRFLEFIGEDPRIYMKALAALGLETDSFYNDWSDHPSINYRIGFLDYLGKHYPMKFNTSQ